MMRASDPFQNEFVFYSLVPTNSVTTRFNGNSRVSDANILVLEGKNLVFWGQFDARLTTKTSETRKLVT